MRAIGVLEDDNDEGSSLHMIEKRKPTTVGRRPGIPEPDARATKTRRGTAAMASEVPSPRTTLLLAYK